MTTESNDDPEVTGDRETGGHGTSISARGVGSGVDEFFRQYPFWHQVAINVVASLIVAFVLACVATTIAIAASGSGSWKDLVLALLVVLCFALIALLMASAGYLAYLLLDGPTGGTFSRTRPGTAAALAWVVALVAAAVAGPEEVAGWIVATGFAMCALLAALSGITLYNALNDVSYWEASDDEIRRAVFRWRFVLTITLCADLFGLFVMGSAIGRLLSGWTA